MYEALHVCRVYVKLTHKSKTAKCQMPVGQSTLDLSSGLLSGGSSAWARSGWAAHCLPACLLVPGTYAVVEVGSWDPGWPDASVLGDPGQQGASAAFREMGA